MKDESKTKKKLLNELREARQLIAEHVGSVFEREWAEEALLDREAALRAITISARDAIIMLDSQGKISFWNKSAEQILGYNETEALGRDLHLMIAPERYHGAYLIGFQHFFDTGQGNAIGKTLELQAVRKDKTEIPVELSLSAFQFRGRWHAIGIIRDITDRKQADEALKKSEERYRAIFENTGNASTLFDETTTILLANTNFEKLSGYSRQELEWKMSWTDFVDHEDLEKMRQYHEMRRMEPSYAPEFYEFRFINRNGEKRDIFLHIAIIPDTKVRIASLIDITERKRSEEVLQESEMRFRALAENSVDTIMRFDRQYRYLYVNPAVQRETGIKPELFIGKTVREMGFPAKLCILWEDINNKIFETGEVKRLEFQLPNGIWIDCIAAPETDAQGDVVAVIISARDITLRKQAEELLKESERHLWDIVEFLPDATLAIDRQGKVTAWNKAMESMTGYSAGDMIGKGDYEYAIPLYGERRPILIDLVLMPKEEVEKKYYHVRRKGDLLIGETDVPVVRGQKRFLSGWAQPIYDSSGGIVGAIECIRDITDKRRAEEALEESEARYRLITDNANDIIFTMDMNLRFTYVSPSVERIHGYTVDEVMTHTLSEILTGASLEEAMTAFQEEQELESEKSGELGRKRALELEMIRKDGSTIWSETTFTLLRNEEKKLIGLLGITRDITERKKAAEEKKRLEMQLAQAQKLESIGTLAGGIAHDFNNILSAIIGFSELARDELPPDNHTRDKIDEVLKASDRAKDLVKQILTFSRQVDVKQRPLAVHLIVREVVRLLRSAIPSTILIEQDIDLDSGSVLADPTEIHQVVMNLCANAYHAMQNTHGTLTISLNKVILGNEISLVNPDLVEGAYVKLEIRDTGCGMDESIIHRIFDPFFTTKEKGHGTGLGLSIVHGIVKNLGGAISVTSNPGSGSVFEVFLPQFGIDVVEETNDPELIPEGNGESILLVDDEVAITEFGKIMLEEIGYSVTTYTSSTEAFKAFCNDPCVFDVVITDQTMPEMRGDQLALEILKVRHDIPVIVITGYSEIFDSQGASSSGIKEIIHKPFSRRKIAKAIHRVLNMVK